jgi:cyclopropane fatty-acyl-phospholipid synthase-like methyltransferase
MTKLVRQEDLKYFYDDAFRNRKSTDEGLMDRVTRHFREFCDGLQFQGGTALDLAYGYGNYSIELARRGFKVTAVDYVSPVYFIKRVKKMGLQNRFEIIQADLNDFVPKQGYDVIISRNVLHYLPRRRIEALLQQCLDSTKFMGSHYLTIFVDIKRESKHGEKIAIEGEAGFSKSEFLSLVDRLYSNWTVNLNFERTEERKPYHFSAKNVILTAQKIFGNLYGRRFSD